MSIASLTALEQAAIITDVNWFSSHVFGQPYDEVAKKIYPRPKYRSFLIAKKSGGNRLILEPRKAVRELQDKALEFLQGRAHAPKPCVHGFVKKRSILSNAKAHIEKNPRFVLNIDLEDFFPSISFYRVRGVFQKAPFYFSHEVATVLAHLCTLNGSLPQGAPTSPLISNLVCRSLDRDLMDLARRHRATYTRYADDISFSFSVRRSEALPESICVFDSGALTLGAVLKGIVETKNHFKINPEKSRISGRNKRMEVTGLTINEFPNVRRLYVDQIRGALHAWQKYGYAAADTQWQTRVKESEKKPRHERPWRRQTLTLIVPQLVNFLWGKLLHLKMVRGSDDAIYTRLAERYNRLCLAEKSKLGDFNAPLLPVNMIVRNAQDAEKSTFVVEWSGDYLHPGHADSVPVMAQGTAFAYGAPQNLVTCDHVLWVEHTLESGGVVVVDVESPHLNSVTFKAIDPRNGLEYPLRILKRDGAPRDLALLEIAQNGLPHRYFVGAESPMRQNEPGWLIGYPNWNPGRHANCASAVVLSRYGRTALQRFEVSRNIRQGNSGGPFVDSLFRVAGVAQQGSTQTEGNDECMCVAELDSWLTV